MEFHIYTPKSIGAYQFKGTIGTGAFSVVKLCYNTLNRKSFACKVIPRMKIDSPDMEMRFENEIRIFQRLYHPGIVSLVDLFKDEQNYYIMMEFCSNGELFQHIITNGPMKESDAKPLVIQFLSALKYIHDNGIAHRDLKPENLLIDQYGNLKIGDFGFSKIVGSSSLVTTPCGSPCYASPECISGNPYDARKSDIWSAGVIIFAMLTSKLPWTKLNRRGLFEQIKNGDYKLPTNLSESCQNFLRSILCVDPAKRASIESSLKHPWLQTTSSRILEKSNSYVVSIKKVDQFFEKFNIKINPVPVIYASTPNLSFNKVSKSLRKQQILPKLKILNNNLRKHKYPNIPYIVPKTILS